MSEGGRLDLARVGFDARRAAQDSAAVAYVSVPGRAPRFAATILEAAAIPQLTTPNPAAAMRRILNALESTESTTALRESVSRALE